MRVHRQRAALTLKRACRRDPLPPPAQHAGHAVLHDFCATIPYGAGLLAAAAASALLGAASARVGYALAAGGLAVCLASFVSLQEWRAGRGSAPYTLASGAVAAGVSALLWRSGATAVGGLAALPAAALLGVSALLAAFCAYNVVAGGNPPKGAGKHAPPPKAA